MSDFILTSERQQPGRLSGLLQTVVQDPLSVDEFHGNWGSLAVSHSLYQGFQVIESAQHIFVVVGGPVLYFRDNAFLVAGNSSTATAAIYERWLAGDLRWDEDLSGPFAVLVVDKEGNSFSGVTDLMGFIPIYELNSSQLVALGTHVDILANATDEASNFDQISLADFVLNQVVTYPYTVYEHLRQLAPATVSIRQKNGGGFNDAYWRPDEAHVFPDINAAANTLREGVSDYVGRVTDCMQEVAHFVSGGEDSRAVAGLLPARLQRHGFVFLDQRNREGRVAEQVARAYGSSFRLGLREKTHYLRILEEACDLVGGGHLYSNAHSLRFHRDFQLASYSAVFGGYLSDTLLKGLCAQSTGPIRKLKFLPQGAMKSDTCTKPQAAPFISDKVLRHIQDRRTRHFEQLAAMRPDSAYEWFAFWPATMRAGIANFYTTRRLFRSYEPFICNESVKIAAAAPIPWKLNRRLFNRAMKPYLAPTKWLFHADGRLPYFNWWLNLPVHFAVWTGMLGARLLGLSKGNQGPWGDYRAVQASKDWQETAQRFAPCDKRLNFLQAGIAAHDLLMASQLTIKQKFSLIQVLYMVSKSE